LLPNSRDWFDYKSMSGQSSRAKLEHAFHLAYERLHVDKLLDWQGFSTLLHFSAKSGLFLCSGRK